MKATGIRAVAGAVVVAVFVAACAALQPFGDAGQRAAVAPSGALRVAVYQGSPTSLVGSPDRGDARGVGYDLGKALAGRLGVPMVLVEFPNNAAALDAVKSGRADFTFTNATPARAQDMDFSPPVLVVEQGYLVAAGSALRAADAVDRPGTRVGVSQGSSSERELGRLLKAATVVPVPTLKVAAQWLGEGKLDVFATNKAILNELADSVAGARILAGRYGAENFAIGIPRGRDAGLPLVRRFVGEARADGTIARAVERAGLRGVSPAD